MNTKLRPLLLILLLLPTLVVAGQQQVVTVEVKGMTCAFCVYGLTKNLKKIPDVQKAEVSLELKLARVTMMPGKKADIGIIKKAITKAGFTPGTVKTTQQE